MDDIDRILKGDNYKKSRSWSDVYMPSVKRLIANFFLRETSHEKDCTEASDLEMVRFEPADIAVRVRRMSKYFARYKGEFTMRAMLPSGKPTELEKILAGNADYSVYAWVDDIADKVQYYTIIDLDVFRDHVRRNPHLLENSQTNPGDGKTFVYFRFVDFPPEIISETNLPGLEVDRVANALYWDDAKGRAVA